MRKLLQRIHVLIYQIVNIHGRNNRVSGFPRYSRKLKISGNNNSIEISKTAHLDNVFILINGCNNNLIIYDNVIYKKGLIYLEDDNNTISIGKETTIEDAELAVAEGNTTLSIGEDCMLSSKIRISTTDSHPIFDITSNLRINKPNDIFIKDHVWIGMFSSVNKGVTIDKGAVIASHSLVTKNVPANSVSAGIPSKTIKTNIYWCRER